ncbi:hypothetical protein LTR64_003657 [Lithohypha guttulata]|uniref:uncharacterized protein n=1 Tax=Lithohypha guttulata TaxID=1690604 RepID=UPI002DDE7D4D|nr:hypothetical protein LTR51_000122 [Lithohypha guttulata]
MYDSLMDHFAQSKPQKISRKDRKEAEISMRSSPSSSCSLQETEKSKWKPTTKELWIMITCALSSLVVALDATILVPVLPTLAVELHGTSTQTFWTGTAYLLSHAVLQPFIATLSDLFGRREALAPSILLFAAGSVICGVAHNFAVMLAGRVVQGCGGAGIITLSQLIFADLVPLRQRPQWFAMVLASWAIGTLVGPLIGGLLVENATWRWCFWLNLPICGLTFPMAVFFLSELTRPEDSSTATLASVDWIGSILFACSLTWFLVAISWAGIHFDWSSWQTIVPLVVGAAGIMITIGYEAKLAKFPFLRRGCFSSISTNACYVAAMLHGLTLYMALYYVSFYFSSVKFYGAVRTGTSLFPATALMLPGSAIVSALITRFGRFRWAIWVGYTLSTIAVGLFILWNHDTPTWLWAFSLSLLGLGMGMILSSVNFSIQASVEPEDAGQAAAMYAFVRSVGMTIGVAVGGTVFQNEMKRKLRSLGVQNATELAKEAEEFIHQLSAMAMTGSEGELRRRILDGYVAGFRGVWFTMTSLAGAGLVVSLLIKKGNLDSVLKSRFRVRRDDVV